MSGRPFVLLGVNNDEEAKTVKDAIKENKLNWRSWWDGDSGPIVKQFEITAFPTLFFIDHTGVIRYKNVRDTEQMDAVIESLVSAAEGDGMVGGSEPTSKFREFVSGKHKTMAAYVDYSDGKVVLKKENEKEVKVSFKVLSPECRQYVAAKRLRSDGKSRLAKASKHFKFDDLFEFTDKSGENSIYGTYIALENGKAIIWKEDGSEIAVSWRQLSETSKDFIKGEIKRYKSGD